MFKKEHLNIQVQGQVQGVSFRLSAQRLAEGLGLTGYARNQPDGSVFIEVEGEPHGLEEFKLWCEEGPRRAKVITVHVEPGSLQHFTDFTVQ